MFGKGGVPPGPGKAAAPGGPGFAFGFGAPAPRRDVGGIKRDRDAEAGGSPDDQKRPKAGPPY